MKWMKYDEHENYYYSDFIGAVGGDYILKSIFIVQHVN